MRLVTALVAVPLIMLLFYKAPPWGSFLLVCPASLIGAYELFSMTHEGDRASVTLGVTLTGIASVATYFGSGDDPRWFVTMAIMIPVLGPVLTLFRLGDMRTAALRACALSMGPLFVGVPLTLLAVLRRDLSSGADPYRGPGFQLLCLMIAWFGDTGGYFAGRYLGKRKLYEAVSPKKTVEGAIGGLAGSMLGATCAHYVYLPSLGLVEGLLLAVVAGALGQAGDLGESLLKRSVGVKDSGQIVPGHGGILDRVDALLMVIACVYVFTLWHYQRPALF
jgi:phosphatidate cytidylyltransferase